MSTTVIVQDETVKVAKVGADNIADSIHGTSEKATPVNADEMGLIDSAASWVLKNITWANVKATLKAYFDTLYAGIDINADITSMTGLDDDGVPLAKVADATSLDLVKADVDVADAITKKHTGNADTGTTVASFKINSGAHEADIKTTRLTGDRDFNFPDVDGGLVIGEMTANNGVECIVYT